MSLVSRALAGGFLTTLSPGEPWFSGLTAINSGELGLEFGHRHVCIFKSTQVTAMEVPSVHTLRSLSYLSPLILGTTWLFKINNEATSLIASLEV